MAFNPDEYLAKKKAETAQSAFDPDAYLASKSGRATEIADRVAEGGRPAALLRKGAQGILGGFYDEGYGALDAIPRYVSDKMKGKDTSLAESYRSGRDEADQILDETQRQFPAESTTANLIGSYLGPGRYIKGAKSALAAGGLLGLGESNADLTKGELGKAAKDTATGAVLSTAGYGVAKAAQPLLTKGANKISGAIKKTAGKVAEKATGATGRQLEKFSDGAGEELLDRGIVRFGDTPKKIAERSGEAMEASNKIMDDVLSELDSAGVKATPGRIIQELDKRIDKLGRHSGDADQKAALLKWKDEVISRLKSSGEKGAPLESKPLSWVEGEKRSFNRDLPWGEPAKAKAKKEAYRAMKDVTEDVATQANPSLAKGFKEAKETYGLLAPIEEAALRRTAQLNQHPTFGLLDIATMGSGGILFGDPNDSLADRGAKGLLTALGRRQIAPRAASSAATLLNEIGKKVPLTPELIKRLAPLLAIEGKD